MLLSLYSEPMRMGEETREGFADLPAGGTSAGEEKGRARVLMPDGMRTEFWSGDLDSLLPEGRGSA